MLPKLTSLQFLVLHLLFAGPQTGHQLRRTLYALGVRQSRTAFSRMMMRLVVAHYVSPQVCTHRSQEQTIRECCYEITDLAILDWTAAQKFYVNLAPPSPDLVPVKTQHGELAAYDPEFRKAIIDRQFAKIFERGISAVAEQMLGRRLQ